MYIIYDNRKYTLIEEPHFEYHDSIGCMSAISSDEWVLAAAVDDSGIKYELWWKCPKTMNINSVINREPDDIIDENGKYLK